MGGARVEVRVRRSRRAQRARIVLTPGGAVEVVLPPGVGARLADELLERHSAWIERRLAASRPVLGLACRGAVWLGGEKVPVERRPGRAHAELRHGRLVVGGGDTESRAALARWYRRHARSVVAEAVEREATRLGLEPGPISIRDQRTRWGSCSGTGSLSFSWRLVVPRRSILDYVVVHELCHLRAPNHSQRFWALVEAARPGWRDDAAWLRRHGGELLAYEPAPGL